MNEDGYCGGGALNAPGCQRVDEVYYAASTSFPVISRTRVEHATQLLRVGAPLEMTVGKHGEANTEEQKKKEKTERGGQKKMVPGKRW